MGRPLKIQKINNSVPTDVGYPNFGSLTNPVKNSADTLTNTQFLGVVGGAEPTDNPSATFPRIYCIVNIANPSGSGLGVHDGYIIRQKGSHKYLVGDADAAIDPANLVVGQAYQIVSVGDTPWSTVGAGDDAGVGAVFTATVGAPGGTSGTCYPVGVCVLADDVTPAAGFMAITYTNSDSTATPISKLTNKFLLDYTGGSGYTAAEVVNDVRLVANFFTDEGTVIKSGTAQVTVDLGIVDEVTS